MTPLQTLKLYDTLDDRTEITRLLRRLPPAKRLGWLRWCCANAPLHKYREIRPHVKRETVELAEKARWDSSADERLTVEAFMDVFYLVRTYDFSLEKALARLVELARRD